MTARLSLCIYCNTHKLSSKAHIIPDALGKGPALDAGICKDCNNRTNSAFENRVIQDLEAVRFMLQLKGRRGKPSVKATVTFAGQTIERRISSLHDLHDKGLIFVGEFEIEGEKRELAVIGTKDFIEQKKRDFSKHSPGRQFHEIDPNQIETFPVEIEFDFMAFASDEMLRTIAKIAFEWLCHRRGSEYCLSSDYNIIRQYIDVGTKPKNSFIVNVCTDVKIWKGLHNIPLGIHSILIGSKPGSHRLIAIVGLFGLVYYKVLLTNRYQCLALKRQDDFCTINPQTGYVYYPVLQGPNARPPDLQHLTQADFLPATKTIENNAQMLKRRWSEGLKELYRQSQTHEAAS